MKSIKKKLYNACLGFAEKRLITVQNKINEIQISLASETKSSAGDKHETGRAMLQLEREKAGNQLAEVQNVKTQLSKVNIEKSSTIIGLGSLVFTTQLNYFIAISTGELNVNNKKYYAISPNTPIGQLLIGKTVGDDISFREQNFIIKKVL